MTTVVQDDSEEAELSECQYVSMLEDVTENVSHDVDSNVYV